jgi:hypothetical protein
MKVISKIAIVSVLSLLVAAGANNVLAACGTPGTTFTSNYFDTPVGQDPAATVGAFWGVGQYDPASPAGHDNGLWASSEWLRYTPGAGFYLAGDWSSSALIDGCIQNPPNPQPARMAVAWTASSGDDSYFVALCSTEDAIGSFGTLVDIPGVPMTQIPKPKVNGSSRAGTTTNLQVGTDPLVGGVYNTGGCTLAVTGFKIYTHTVPRGITPTASRNSNVGWTLLGSSSGADVSGQVTCAVDSDIYLMSTVVLDGNVELKSGSRNGATKVECGPNLAQPGDDNFRLIRKPKAGKGR